MKNQSTIETETRGGSCAPVTGSAPALNREQISILDHTEHRAARGLYCGGGKEMAALVALGMMESAGRAAWWPDEYFRITGKGRTALRQAQDAETARVAVGSTDLFAVDGKTDLCLRMMIYAAFDDKHGDMTCSEARDRLGVFFPPQTIERALALSMAGHFPPPVDLDAYSANDGTEGRSEANS